MEGIKQTHLYDRAAELLQSKLLDTMGMIEKVKSKSGETESTRFWDGVILAMNHALQRIYETDWIHRRAIQVEAENQYLRERNHYLTEELNKYRVVESLMASGEMNQIMNEIKNVECRM